jgi:hypothetical protein
MKFPGCVMETVIDVIIFNCFFYVVAQHRPTLMQSNGFIINKKQAKDILKCTTSKFPPPQAAIFYTFPVVSALKRSTFYFF